MLLIGSVRGPVREALCCSGGERGRESQEERDFDRLREREKPGREGQQCSEGERTREKVMKCSRQWERDGEEVLKREL